MPTHSYRLHTHRPVLLFLLLIEVVHVLHVYMLNIEGLSDAVAQLHIEYPMLFKVENKRDGRSTHCGVLEFVADEGSAYLPYWVRWLSCQRAPCLGAAGLFYDVSKRLQEAGQLTCANV